MVNFKALILSVLISLGVGGLSGLLVSDSFAAYRLLELPPLSPPPELFPIIWTVLYILMGVAAYLVAVSENPDASDALTAYGIQLVMNFVWPLLFFGAKLYLVSFLWLIALFAAIAVTAVRFYRIRPAAGYLMLPYLLWVGFAGYLNLTVYLLNRAV